MKKRLIFILAAAVLLTALGLGLQGIDRSTLLGKLPGGHWWEFRGGAGRDSLALRDVVNVLNSKEPQLYDLPEGLQYLTPENLRRVLKDKKVEPIPMPESMKSMTDPHCIFSYQTVTGVKNYFGFGFVYGNGNSCELWVLDDGTIAVRCYYNTSRDYTVRRIGELPMQAYVRQVSLEFYRDNGECYAALKEAFGDMDDIENWKVQTREEQQ